MKELLLTLFLAAIIAGQNLSNAQTQQPQSNSNKSVSSSNSSALAAQGNQPQQAPASSPPPATPGGQNPSNSQPPNEPLSANEQVLNRVASMYQDFGLFITIIVTLVGIIAAGVSYVARKNAQEFIQEWTKKMESLDSEMKSSLTKLRDIVAEAEDSARKAHASAQSISDSELVLNNTLTDVDHLRAAVVSLQARIGGEELPTQAAQPTAEAAAAAPPSEEVAADEDAEVAARLSGRINPPEDEGQES